MSVYYIRTHIALQGVAIEEETRQQSEGKI